MLTELFPLWFTGYDTGKFQFRQTIFATAGKGEIKNSVYDNVNLSDTKAGAMVGTEPDTSLYAGFGGAKNLSSIKTNRIKRLTKRSY
jgi:hypothetical protein